MRYILFLCSAVLICSSSQFTQAAQICKDVQSSSNTFLPISLVRLQYCEPVPPPCKICKMVQKQLKKGCQARNGNISPYADSVFTRNKIKFSITSTEHKSIIAAAISQHPQFAWKATEKTRNSSNIQVRFAANLTTAYTMAKANFKKNKEYISEIVDALQKDAEKIPFSTADIDFLEALLAIARGNRSKALARLDIAIKKEPHFFNAAVLATRLQIIQIRKNQHFSPHECRKSYDQLFHYLGLLLDLKPCPRQAVHAEIFLRRQFQNPDSNPAIAATRVYFGIIARKKAYAQQALEHFERIGKSSCKSHVSGQLRELLVQTSAMIKRN